MYCQEVDGKSCGKTAWDRPHQRASAGVRPQREGGSFQMVSVGALRTPHEALGAGLRQLHECRFMRQRRDRR